MIFKACKKIETRPGEPHIPSNSFTVIFSIWAVFQECFGLGGYTQGLEHAREAATSCITSLLLIYFFISETGSYYIV